MTTVCNNLMNKIIYNDVQSHRSTINVDECLRYIYENYPEILNDKIYGNNCLYKNVYVNNKHWLLAFKIINSSLCELKLIINKLDPTVSISKILNYKIKKKYKLNGFNVLKYCKSLEKAVYQNLLSMYRSGKINGVYNDYHDNGNLNKTTTYISGKKNGLCRTYDKYKNVTIDSYYRDDKLNGEYDEYDSSGNIKLHAHYINDNLNGKYLSYNNENGMIKLDTFYVLNKKNGITKKYYPNGRIKYITVYCDDMLNGPYKSYYDLDSIESFYNIEKKHNKKRKIVDDVVKVDANYVNGHLDGKYVEYYPNHTTKIRTTYKDGSLHGKYEEYYENEILKIETNYNLDNIDGDYRQYHDNNQLHIYAKYKKGKLNDEYLEYLSDGHLVIKLIYNNGKLEGSMICTNDETNVSTHVDTFVNK